MHVPNESTLIRRGENAHYGLVRVKGSQPTVIWPVDAPIYVAVHWCAHLLRTQPCLADECPGCRAGDPRRPMSYVPVYHWRLFAEQIGWYRAVLEVPARTGVQLERMVGRAVAMRRARAGGVIETTIGITRAAPESVTPWPVLPSLHRLWRTPLNRALTDIEILEN